MAKQPLKMAIVHRCNDCDWMTDGAMILLKLNSPKMNYIPVRHFARRSPNWLHRIRFTRAHPSTHLFMAKASIQRQWNCWLLVDLVKLGGKGYFTLHWVRENGLSPWMIWHIPHFWSLCYKNTDIILGFLIFQQCSINAINASNEDKIWHVNWESFFF